MNPYSTKEYLRMIAAQSSGEQSNNYLRDIHQNTQITATAYDGLIGSMQSGLNALTGTVVLPPMGLLHPATKLKDAIAYLRSSGMYCLDQKQPRIAPKAEPETILGRWLKERRK